VEAVPDKMVQAATEKQPSIRYTPETMMDHLRLWALHPRNDFRQKLSRPDQRAYFKKERGMKFYLCKYIPPRTDFLATMTAEEGKWMKQHGDFLNNLLDKGLIVAHGPVMDPSGGYGVSLYQISDDQDIATITSEDPIVKNGAGRYEHYPMLHLKSRVTAPLS
jgi:uncharacterized protein YciI